MGQGRPGGRSAFGRVWVLDENKNLRMVMVRTGLTDSRYIEVVGGELKEGDEVILGVTSGDATASASSQQNNPFAPRMMGGPGGGRGR
jgi:HlyD family secretion protein